MTGRSLDLAQCRVTLVVNGKAGRMDADDRVALIRRRLEPLVREFRLSPVRHGRDLAKAARAAAESGSEVVAALGGDGTQSAVAHGLAGTGAVMAVLPGGTFNYFARELGVESLDAAMQAVVGGQVASRDLGVVNGRSFINNASIGLYPRILEQREDIYRRWGRSRMAAYGSVLMTLAELRPPMHLSLQVDGRTERFHTPLAFVARSAYQLESLGLEGADAVRAGHLAVFVARGTTRGALLAATLRLAFRRTARGEDFDLVIADRVQFEIGSSRTLVALDGEKSRMRAPFVLEVQRAALQVLVPRGTDRP